MTAPDPRPAAQGMTLVEILVVIVIIAILAGITFVAANRIRAGIAEGHTENVIRELAGVFEQYREKTGSYPPDSAVEVLKALKAVKLADAFAGQPTGRTGSRLAWQGSDVVVCDYWGTPIHFRVPGDSSKNGPGPDIWSSGPDRTDDNGEGDDIANWKLR